MYQTLYAWADVTLAISYVDAPQAAQIDGLWQTFFCLTPVSTPQPGLRLSIQFLAEATSQARPPLLQALWRSGKSSVWQTPYGFCLQCGSTWLAFDPTGEQAYGVLTAEFWDSPLAEQRDFFLRTLLMLVRQTGIYGLHANGVTQGADGMLIVGSSGSGKTTLSLSLVQAGWCYLGDDAVALCQTGAGVVALALQRGFACTAQTAAFFPNLQVAATHELDPVRHKQQVMLERLYGQQFASTCLPRQLLFPKITGEAHSRVTPLDETQAMLGLMQQSAGLLIEARTAARQMDSLKQLASQVHSHQLLLGRDVYTDPAAVAALLGTL